MRNAKRRSASARKSGMVRAYIRAGRKVRAYVRGASSRGSLGMKAGAKRNTMFGGGSSTTRTVRNANDRKVTASGSTIKEMRRHVANVGRTKDAQKRSMDYMKVKRAKRRGN